MTGPDMLRGAMRGAHEHILLGGALGAASVLAGLASRRIGAPILLTFLALGMLAGEDGVLGIPFDDFGTAYLVGSVALAVILFEGGLKTSMAEIRPVLGPAAVLATLGVAITALVMGGSMALIAGVPLPAALLAGAIAAPTDAAAVATMLRQSGAVVPERLLAVLEVESGLNDPMSVFLTFALLKLVTAPAMFSAGGAALSFIEEMVGGGALGVAAGWALGWALRRLPMEQALATVLALTGGLCVFGLGQLLGFSGFLATYLAGVVTGSAGGGVRKQLEPFFDGMGWLAQIVLFLMLGLLVTPHDLPPYIPVAVLGTAVLLVVARPIAVFTCLLPFRFGWRESAFASWVGLRGAVPIYLSIIPALADPGRDERLFASMFIVVIASLLAQGWTVAPAARLLGFGRRLPAPAAD